ncbi:hypothetical protein IEQ34_002149 [Dendrobium chrysotoxum]|uniref:RING-type E3 ubiquitin transferase n=1 Tax=Dendrobium chrysotoxum TaxID=161865 RepID=A0AAV7HMN3_DENCH|nr:hypothetical protein IEQ34_002149 [Dendrobium chrysotoxum]
MGEDYAGVLETAAMLRRMIEAIEKMPSASDFCNTYKKQFCCLSRQIKLFTPMLDELWDRRTSIPEEAIKTLVPFAGAIAAAGELLQFGKQGSKIYMVLARDRTLQRFKDVNIRLEHALDVISFNKLGITVEVREQVDLVHGQFKRAKDPVDGSDIDLYNDLSSIYKCIDSNTDSVILRRVVENLQLSNISNLTQESVALHELVVLTGGADPEESLERMSMLLKKMKDFVLTQNHEMENRPNPIIPVSKGSISPLTIPEDFRCPICLELMKDPVIVTTGQLSLASFFKSAQTYERRCIEKWLEDGHVTCPKTQQRLHSRSLTPNFVVRSLISHWVQANGLHRPFLPNKPASCYCLEEHENVTDLIFRLSSRKLEDQCSAAAELRLLAKMGSAYQRCIADAGAVPLLATLLSQSDPNTQEHAVAALLNLSIVEDNKELIISSGALPKIVHVLKNGSMEARQNAAATLFSLSSVDENKVLIGCASGAIPALVSLLSEGGEQGKKDAASALFNLCICNRNKSKAVRAGVVPALVNLLMEPGGLMIDMALTVLANVSSHPNGKAAILAAVSVSVLVELIRSKSSRNSENAASILLHLCVGEQQPICLAEAQECGAIPALQALAVIGTDRAKRKAVLLLEYMNIFRDQQMHALSQTKFHANSC